MLPDWVVVMTLVATVEVEAVPVKAAVMVPAEKLPELSRLTIILAVFKLVASLTAEEGMEMSWAEAAVNLPLLSTVKLVVEAALP